ncbi:hypothetical protein GOODEAATRI_002218 [Goodea atripinnis]|uniref:ATP synthase F0 subunit 6 n=1 Tax=Goodea atripinnis TaxID=208336 RepID=A0ABV0PK32_9TELE
MRSLGLGPQLGPPPCLLHQSIQLPLGTSLSGTMEKHTLPLTHMSISFPIVFIPAFLFMSVRCIVLPFFTIFPLSGQAWASFMMNVFNNLFSISGGGEGGSQFRGITLTGETVNPWLPRVENIGKPNQPSAGTRTA